MITSDLFEKAVKRYQEIWRELYSNGSVTHSKLLAFYSSWDAYLQDNSITHQQWIAALKYYVPNKIEWTTQEYNDRDARKCMVLKVSTDADKAMET